VPIANVCGVNINYQVLGDHGPWVALSPGGRRDLEGVRKPAQLIADAGYRVLIHDRRNCGASDVVIEGEDSEYEIWADDLHALLGQLNALPAFIGGSSAGCRMSLLFGLRHPEATRGLLLWRVTGGHYAANRLAENYYGQFLTAFEQGGMAAVCATEHFSERIAANPSNRERLMSMDPVRFVEVMTRWRQHFYDGADLPVIGCTEADLRSLTMPVCVIPGNDQTHPRAVGLNAARLIPNAELHVLMAEDAPDGEPLLNLWDAKDAELAATFVDFMNHVSATAPVA
jgi:pimeloyl-ACP methyl ester carboxylesterase